MLFYEIKMKNFLHNFFIYQKSHSLPGSNEMTSQLFLLYAVISVEPDGNCK